MERIFVVISKRTCRIGCQRRTITTSRVRVGIYLIYQGRLQTIGCTESSKTTVLIGRIDVTIWSINRVTIICPTKNRRVLVIRSKFLECCSLWIKEYVITNHIAKFFRINQVSILTTELVVISCENITSSEVIFGFQLILKVFSPLEDIRCKFCKFTNRFQSDCSQTLGIVNTSVLELNADNSTFIFTDSTDNCFSNSTETITIDYNVRCSGITLTRVDNSDRNDTTVNNNRLCKSTSTRVDSNSRK